jgi:hypothetical protein
MKPLIDTTTSPTLTRVGSDIPPHHLTLITRLRATIRDPHFVARHRVRPQDFTRQCPLTFPVLLLCILQKSVKSIQRHLNEFLAKLAPGGFFFEPVTPGAVTHARAKFQDSAFVNLNQDHVLPVFYEAEPYVQRWHSHRLVGIDSSLCRLPNRPDLGEEFGWNQVTNQIGDTGTRYPEGRISVLYDLRNRLGLDARWEPSRLGEVARAREQLVHVQPGDVVLTDCGFTGYVFLAAIRQREAHFIARCSTGSFLAAQELFRRDRAHQSRVVWLNATVPTFSPSRSTARGVIIPSRIGCWTCCIGTCPCRWCWRNCSACWRAIRSPCVRIDRNHPGAKSDHFIGPIIINAEIRKWCIEWLPP